MPFRLKIIYLPAGLGAAGGAGGGGGAAAACCGAEGAVIHMVKVIAKESNLTCICFVSLILSFFFKHLVDKVGKVGLTRWWRRSGLDGGRRRRRARDSSRGLSTKLWYQA